MIDTQTDTHTHEHIHTDADNDNTRRPKLASGKNQNDLSTSVILISDISMSDYFSNIGK